MFRQSLRVVQRRNLLALPRAGVSSRFYSTDLPTESEGPKSIAVVLSGCGFLDGTEITEATSLIINLSKQSNWKVTYYAPNGDLDEVIDHSTRNVEKNETRNIQSEVSRITRDKVVPLETLTPEGIDAVIFPGGFGAGKVLSNYGKADRGTEPLGVIPSVSTVIKSFHKAKKPMGFMCLSSILPSIVLGRKNGGPGVIVTLGDEEGIAKDAADLGNEIRGALSDGVVIDEENKIISTPAYLSKSATPYDVFQGSETLITELTTLFSGKKKDDGSGVSLGALDEVLEETLGSEQWQKEKAQIFRRK